MKTHIVQQKAHKLLLIKASHLLTKHIPQVVLQNSTSVVVSRAEAFDTGLYVFVLLLENIRWCAIATREFKVPLSAFAAQ